MPFSSSVAEIHFYQNDDGSCVLKSIGDWTVDTIQNVVSQLDKLSQACRNNAVLWDMSGVGEIDSAGALLFIQYHDKLQQNSCTVSVSGMTAKHQKLTVLLRKHIVEPPSLNSKPLSINFLAPFQVLGRWAVTVFTELILFLSFFGKASVVFFDSLRHPSTIRYAAIVKNIEDAGVHAIPIVGLTSFLIGIVITYQGAVQLEKFGANIFIVEMISISVTRELAPLITAIVVAGRTGSAYTAQLGVMKITEEMDAMRTMGFDPHHFLVIPRILALMIALPLLVFLADIIGIMAGMLISDIHLQISFAEFIHRLQNVLDIKHVWIGLIKAPFFAFLIATVSCFRGFQVKNNSDSIGRYTTISVVNAIFLVIACDAIFSVILTELGI